MDIEGKLILCDHPECDEKAFCKRIGEGEADGGFTRWNKYEKDPDGWGWREGKRLCPKHFKELNDLIDGFYRIKGDTNE